MAANVPKGYKSTRAVYKAVKKYDHAEFDRFCTDLYMNGYQDGKNSVKGMDISVVMDVISGVKGVGPALFGRIKSAVDDKFEKRGEKE